jgi:hypothetical protein
VLWIQSDPGLLFIGEKTIMHAIFLFWKSTNGLSWNSQKLLKNFLRSFLLQECLIAKECSQFKVSLYQLRNPSCIFDRNIIVRHLKKPPPARCLIEIFKGEKKINFKLWPGNTNGGRITVPLTSCLTGLESAVWQLTFFCFYLQNRLIQTSQTGGRWYSDTSPFSIPCFD